MRMSHRTEADHRGFFLDNHVPNKMNEKFDKTVVSKNWSILSGSLLES